MNTASFKAIFDNSLEGILVINKKGVIVKANPSAEKLLGYNYDELVNQNIEILIPTRYKNHSNYFNNYLQDPVPRPLGMGLDLSAICKNGDECYIDVSLSPFYTDGEIHILIFIIDNTYRRKYEYELKKKINDRTLMLGEVINELKKVRQDYDVD